MRMACSPKFLAIVSFCCSLGLWLPAQAQQVDCSESCEESGRCFHSKVFDECVDGPSWCEYEDACHQQGRCRFDPASKACVATAEDCERSYGCVAEGRCAFDASTASCIRAAAGCRQSERCLDEGLCASKGERCVAASDEDCARSFACIDAGRCQVRGESCVVESDDDCGASQGCQAAGQCYAVDAKGKRSQDPASTVACGHAGLCAESASCRQRGLCAERGAVCGPTSEDHCRQSEACALDGACQLVEERGMLGSASTHCAPTSAADCEGKCGGAKDCALQTSLTGHKYCAVVEAGPATLLVPYDESEIWGEPNGR
ncbi:MAG: hypothetical protein RBU37_20620 [Myxococcota bacterium]|jgi:hypothetical protein|nr:hypothetical protein [Myxococcota bacterium]